MFFRKNKTQSKTKITSLLIGLALYLTTQSNIITHAAENSGYVLGIAPDFNRFMYQTVIGTEEHNWDEDRYSEFAALHMNSTVIRDLTIPNTIKEEDWNVSKQSVDCWGNQKCTMFLFPANNSNAADHGPTQKDSEAMNRVTSQVVTSLNQAINFVFSNAIKDGKPLIAHDLSETERKEWFFKITSELGNHTIKMQDNKDEEKNQTGKYESDLSISGIDNTFHIKKKNGNSSFLILSTGDKSIELRYRILKYPEGTVQGSDDADRGGEYRTIYWTHIVWYGNANYIHRNVDATSISELASEGFVAELLYDLLEVALNGIRSMLGLQPIQDVVFNQGNYANTNWRGIAPTEWFEAGNILMWICQVIAWLTLALALVWRFGSTMWGTVTTFKYVTLVESIKDIFTASISTALIYPIFMTLTNFNVLLVDIMANLTIFNDRISTSSVGGGTIAGILISILFFGVEIYFNFTYILRGITIVLLYGLAPMFFMVYAFGGGFKSITMKYIKELVGNIFIHTFHATFLAFFAIFMNTSNSGLFVQIVLLYAFIPMTKLFKSLTGIGESDFISSTADQAKNNIKSAGNAVVGGAVAGVIAGKTMKGNSKGGGDNGGGGTFRGDSMSGNFGGDTSNGSLGGRLARSAKNKTTELARGAKDKFTQSRVGQLSGKAANTVGNLANSAKDKLANSSAGQALSAGAKTVANSSVGKGAATVGKYAKKGAIVAGKSLYKGHGKELVKGAAKVATGAAMTGAGAILGNSSLTTGGVTLASGGISGAIQTGKDMASDLETVLHGREIQTSDNSHIGGYYNEDGSRTDTYSKTELYSSTGIENMDITKDNDGNDVLRQKIDTSKLSDENRQFLETIETDNGGNVASQELRESGLTNVQKTHDGKYIVQYDAKIRGMNGVKRSGNKFIVNQSGMNNVSLDHLSDIRNEQEIKQKEITETTKKKALLL